MVLPSQLSFGWTSQFSGPTVWSPRHRMSCTKRFRGRLQQESTRDNPRGGHAMYSEACVMPRLIFSKIVTLFTPQAITLMAMKFYSLWWCPTWQLSKVKNKKIKAHPTIEVEQNKLLKEDRTTIFSVEKYACLKSSRLHFLIVPS